ncbi:MAG: S8 family serine peptidase [Chloroflexota bacterium]
MRIAIGVVLLATLAGGAVFVHGITGDTDAAHAAEAIVHTSAPDIVSTTNTADIDTHDEQEADAAPRNSVSGISATTEQRQALEERWGMERIDVTGAWDTAGTFAPVLVAVLDTGIDPAATYAHRTTASMGFNGEGYTTDEHGHGTHMADTIAHIAPNANLLNLKVADKRGRTDSLTVAQAVRWAADHGADVINISLEVAASPELQSAVQHAWDKGTVVVSAAGNSGSTEPAYPAAYDEAIAVAGTNEQDGLAVLSNHGEWVDIAAPGFKIYAEALGGDYDLETGTSPAAAHVSGVAALLYGIANDTNDNGLVNDEVREALELSATALSVSGTGSGVVDAREAVSFLLKN